MERKISKQVPVTFYCIIYFQHLRKLHKFLKKKIEKNVCSQAFFSLKVNFDRKCLS